MEKFKSFLEMYHKRIILILFIIIFVILLAASIYLITLDDGTYKEGDMSNTPYAASTYIKSVKFTENGIKFIYKDQATGVEEEKTSSEMAQIIWTQMTKAGSNVENYLYSVEELEKLMNAEIITQYPKLNRDVDLNGTIEFQRHRTDGTSYMLEYINFDTFNQYIQNNNIEIERYFTLDENDNLLIGIVNETTETLTSNDSEMSLSDYTDTLSENDSNGTGNYSKTIYSVESKAINYKNAISKYTMPFQYLWSFIVAGDDKGIGLELADLVENSQIIISIYDNITTSVDKSTYTYNREKKVDVSATAKAETNYGDYTKSDSWKPADEWEENNYEINHTITYKNNNPIFDVTKADVWVVDYNKNYTYQASQQISQNTNERDLDDTDYIEEEGNPETSSGNGSDLPYYDKFKENLKRLKDDLKDEVENSVQLKKDKNGKTIQLTMDTSITSCKASYYKHNVNIHEVDISTVSEQKYIAEPAVNEPKVEKKTKEEIQNGTGQDNFVTILCDANHTEARKKITEEITDWLFELLEENPDTVNMVDLTKFLLYKVTGKDYGVTEYDFSVYEQDAFSSAGTGLYNGTIQQKVWFALKDAGYSDIAVAGAMGNIDYESAGFTTTAVEGNGEGIGLCQWSFGRKAQFLEYAKSKGVQWQDEDTQVEFLIAEITGQGAASGYASHRVKGYIKDEGIYSTVTDWANSTTVEDATLHFMRFFESPKSKNSLGERTTRAYKYYNEFQGQTAPVDIDTSLTGDNKEKMQQMITEAIRIANDDRYQYSQPFRESEFYYDCSSFVSRLYTKFFGIGRLDSGTAGRGTDNIRANCQNSKVSMNSLQPGDILWRDGHVALYIGNGQTAEAASTRSGILVKTMGSFTEAYRIIR